MDCETIDFSVINTTVTLHFKEIDFNLRLLKEHDEEEMEANALAQLEQMDNWGSREHGRCCIGCELLYSYALMMIIGGRAAQLLAPAFSWHLHLGNADERFVSAIKFDVPL